MTLKQLARERMIRGKAAHPNECWEELSNAELMCEAREELADCYNYFSKQKTVVREAAYYMLGLLWKLSFKK